MAPYSERSSPGATIIQVEDVKTDKFSPLGHRSAMVYKGTLYDQVVAVKVLSSELPANVVIARVALWQTTLSHPNLLRIFGVSPPEADPLFIVTPCYQNVRQFLTMYPNVERSNLIFEVALGMQFLHKRGLVHAGLRPSNILIDDEGHIRLSDYGMVEIQSTRSTDAHRYYSPEAWKGTTSGPSDVYSFAMSAYEIFTSTAPWGVLSEKHIYQLVVYENGRPDRPAHEVSIRVGLSNQFWSIIEESWHEAPRLRPSFDIIVRLWQSASGDDPLATSQAPLSLYPPRQNLTESTTFSSSGPPAYEAGNPEASLTMTVRECPPPNSAQTARPLREFTRVPSPSQNVRRHNTYGPRPPHSAPVFLPFGSIEESDEFDGPPVSPLQSPPPRGRGTSSVPSMATPFSPRFYVARGGYDSTRPGRYQSSRPLPSNAAPHFISPCVSLSASSNSSPVNDLMPATPTSVVSTSVTASMSPQRQDSAPRHELVLPREIDQQKCTAELDGRGLSPDAMLTRSDSNLSTIGGRPSPVFLVGALQAELNKGRNRYVIDDYLVEILFLAAQSTADAQKLITAGAIPILIRLLKLRAADLKGTEVLLMTLGYLAHDTFSANAIYRTNTVSTLIEIFDASSSPEVLTLSCWCLNRLCRDPEIAASLIKQNLVRLLVRKGLKEGYATPSMSAYCLGTLVHSDGLADILATMGVIQALADFLYNLSKSKKPRIEDVCSALYSLARISRSTKLARSIAKAGCVPLILYHLGRSDNPQVLSWSARAVGCLMRPNSSDIPKMLLDAGVAAGLARMPKMLPSKVAEPLSSFAFAIQRFSCAEWESGTRKRLVEAGLVDSLLAALRTTAEEPYPQVHTDLALAVSFLSDAGGSPIRKEIVNAGGVDILRKVAATVSPEAAKACNIAIKSTTGNLWSRNAASAKAALTHNWSGGCPEFQPLCPLMLTEEPVHLTKAVVTAENANSSKISVSETEESTLSSTTHSFGASTTYYTHRNESRRTHDFVSDTASSRMM